MLIDDIRKALESMIGLTPAKAQELAKRYLEPGAAKDQVQKTAADLLRLQQRLRDAIRKEVTSQVKSMGGATQDDLDALRKRVRVLERRAGMTASGRKKAAARKKTAAKKSAAASRTASGPAGGGTSTTS
jgi:polyhydroxyalkanoate synthesis regulator phasin